MADISVRLKAYSENPTKTVIKSGDFEFIIDEPASLGGTNHGPSPVEFLLGAYAGCLNVVGHIVAKEMNMNLKGIKLEVSGRLNPAKLLGQGDEERAGFKGIKVRISPDTDAGADTLNKWLEQVKARCPIGDNLANTTPVTIEIK